MSTNKDDESIQLEGETVFFHHLSQDKEKLERYQKAVSEGKITDFDPTVLTKLRKLYYAFYSGLIYIYYEPTDFENIAHKLELLTYALEDKKFQIVHGSTDSTRDIQFARYGTKHLDYNSWIEVEEGQKTWVYDLFSLKRMEKGIYYQLEHPDVSKIIPGEAVINHPARAQENYTNFHDGFIEILFAEMPQMEKNVSHHPFKEILSPELMRFKADIHYDDLLLKVKEEFVTIKEEYMNKK